MPDSISVWDKLGYLCGAVRKPAVVSCGLYICAIQH